MGEGERVCGCARAVDGVGGSSPSSGSMIPNPASVVSIPSAVPLRAPASGMKSMGRGFTPERTLLFEVSSLMVGKEGEARAR